MPVPIHDNMYVMNKKTEILKKSITYMSESIKNKYII